MICKECGVENDPERVYCRNCGFELISKEMNE